MPFRRADGTLAETPADSDKAYHIIDEPGPTRGPWIAVNPFWPRQLGALAAARAAGA